MIHIALIFASWVNVALSQHQGLSFVDREACNLYSSKYHVPLKIAQALRYTESRNRRYAIHHNNGFGPDIGLYQINWNTYLWLSQRYNDGVLKWPYDPVENTKMALHYLSDLYTVTGNWTLALRSFNAGLTATLAHEEPVSTVYYAQYVLKRAGM